MFSTSMDSVYGRKKMGETTYLGPTALPFQIYYLFNIMIISLKHV